MAKGIAIKVDEELQRSVHIRVARLGTTLQDYACMLMEKDLHPKRFPKLTQEQEIQIKELTQELLEKACQLEACIKETNEPRMGGMTLG